MSDSAIPLSLTLDPELYHAAERCAADCGFADVPALIEYLLRGALRVEDRARDEQELQLVEERLRQLGYLE